MQRNGVFASIVAILVLAAVGYAAWHFVKQRSAQSCKACARPVHSHMKTVAIVDGKRTVYCCPACALSEHQQSGKPVQVVELTDYLSSGPLKPETSFVVRNSDVNPCLQHHPAVGENSQPLEAHFDRCTPSVLVFQDQKSAAAFASKHGGQVVSFSDFASELRQQGRTAIGSFLRGKSRTEVPCPGSLASTASEIACRPAAA